jgi:hypothetical protein
MHPLCRASPPHFSQLRPLLPFAEIEGCDQADAHVKAILVAFARLDLAAEVIQPVSDPLKSPL